MLLVMIRANALLASGALGEHSTNAVSFYLIFSNLYRSLFACETKIIHNQISPNIFSIYVSITEKVSHFTTNTYVETKCRLIVGVRDAGLFDARLCGKFPFLAVALAI